MAITKLHAIHGNIQNCLDYITNLDKTEKELIGSKGSSVSTAGIVWK